MNAVAKLPKGRRERSLALKNAEAALAVWWERRLYLRRNRIPPKGADDKVILDVPDEYLRPQGFVGPSAARPDGTTAWGVESKSSRAQSGGWPGGQWISLQVVDRDERDEMRQNEVAKAEALTITERAILRLGLIEPRYWLAIEMYAAGYSERNIAAAFGIDKRDARCWIDAALCWLAGCLIIKPDFGVRDAGPERRMAADDLKHGRKAPTCRYAIWEDISP